MTDDQSELAVSTKEFFSLTPERILDAAEAFGVRCTGRVLALNSMENRVYEVEIEIPDDEVNTPSDRFRVIKFYRPGRWSRDQIGEEHSFIADLAEAEIPVVPPIAVGGETLVTLPDVDIHCALFKKVGGRSTDELDDEGYLRLGRLIARVHQAGQVRTAKDRITLNEESYGLANLEFLISSKTLPEEIVQSYSTLVQSICSVAKEWLKETTYQRVHGDLHFGNILMGRDGMFLVDFDDMVIGPPVQDLWLVLPGRDDFGKRKLELFLQGYEQLRRFDRRSLKTIECLRALRFVHYTAWVARRWEDPSFPRAFPNFGSTMYWREQLSDLYEQWELIQQIASGEVEY